MTDKKLLKELDEYGTAYITEYARVERLPTGSLHLDFCFNGGIPRGLTTLLSGPEGSGKTTLVMLSAIETKRQGRWVDVIDVERRWNMEYAYESGLGVPGKDYGLLYPSHAEGALETIRVLARAGRTDLCILDSIAALSPKAEIDGDMSDQHMALVARLLGQFFRASEAEIANSGMALLMTNQVRTGFGSGFAYTVKPGGRAKDFWPSIAANVDKPEPTAYEYRTDDDKGKKQNPIGMTITGKTYKNTVGPNFVPFEVPVRHLPALHTDRPAEIFSYALSLGLFAKEDGTPVRASTAKCFFEGVELGVGAKAVIKALREELDTQQAVENAVRSAIVGRSGVFSLNGKE